MRVDFHCHSTASDGELPPAALLRLLADDGVGLAAITDHDTLGAYDAIAGQALPEGLRLIGGIEFSATHEGREIHVVGLGFDPCDPGLREAVALQTGRRRERARRIAERLERLGVPGALEAVSRIAGEGVPGRPHFARFLVEAGRVRDADEAFDRYLGSGKPAGVPIDWPGTEQVTGWIRTSGGVAVLAHPLAYAFARTRGKLRGLIGAFRECGGAAVEVAVAGASPDRMQTLARHVREAGLRASAGSDFHGHAQPWRRPCRVPSLPDFLEPVWSEWL